MAHGDHASSYRRGLARVTKESRIEQSNILFQEMRAFNVCLEKTIVRIVIYLFAIFTVAKWVNSYAVKFLIVRMIHSF